MKVSVKDSAPCEKLLSISVSGDVIQEEYEHYFDHISKEAKVPGFRPGKAPKDVLRIHYRENAREKVLENLIRRSLREAVGEKKIAFLGSPAIEGVQFTEDQLSYDARLEVPPAVKLKKYKGLSAEKPQIEVKTEEVDKALQEVRQSLAKFAAVEDRPARMGDFVMADYRCVVDGQEADQKTDDWFELKEDEFLKGFSGQLAGSKPGDDREVRIRFPEEFGRKEWAGKEGVFQVKVKEIKIKKLLPLDDELAKETGEFQTLQALKEHLEKQIRERKGHEAESEYESRLINEMIKENPFEVPKGVVDRRQEDLTESAIRSLYRNGVQPEIIQKEGKALFEKLRPEAEKQVRVSFLLDEIAAKENLTLKDSDFEEKYKLTAERHRQTVEAVKKYYEEHPDAKKGLEMQILNEKALQLIKDNVTLKK